MSESKQTPETNDRPSASSSSAGGRMAKNVLWSWGGHFVFMLSGFLLPRAIDHQAGKAILGIWDFAWSIVSYFSLIEFGVSSSVNRYVAKHLAEKNPLALNRVISSVFCIQLMVGGTILILTGAVVYAIPSFWGARLGSLTREAQWLVFFLGLSSTVGWGFGVFAGVLTGCHRWGLYNGINATCQALMVTGVLVSLSLGNGIRTVGAIYALTTFLQVMTTMTLAHRLCPTLKVRYAHVNRSTMKQMLSFGGKTFLNGMARALLYQTSSVLIASSLGPQVLAVYSRPLALVGAAGALVSKFAHILTPIASEMHAAGHRESLQELAVKMARVGVALGLPPMLFLSILGGPLLAVWMGPDYRDDFLPIVLALGHLWAIANLPLQTILTGMDAHGRPALASAISAALCAGSCWLAVGPFHQGVHAIALCVALSVALAGGAYVTFYTCGKLGTPVLKFLAQAWGRPLWCALPFALWLLAARMLFSPLYSLLWGGLGSGLILCFVYWHWILPDGLKNRLRTKGGGALSSFLSLLGIRLKSQPTPAE